MMKPFHTRRVALRGLEHQVFTWGDPAAPKLFLLHGWMDVGASFQFLVDALAGDWFAIAPDLRGFGRTAWQPQGYWFPDYVADLDALLDVFAPEGKVNLAGHSLGGNVVMHYAGVRAERVRAVASLEGFGIPGEAPAGAPKKFTRWLDALKDVDDFKPYPDLAAVARRLQKTNPRLQPEKALFLAAHWAEVLPDGTARLTSDPRHKLPVPHVYRMEETTAIWRGITAPLLWVAADDSHIPKWLAGHPEGELGADGLGAVRERLAAVGHGRLAVVADASHMLHHDQPEAVAAVIEPFFRADAAR